MQCFERFQYQRFSLVWKTMAPGSYAELAHVNTTTPRDDDIDLENNNSSEKKTSLKTAMLVTDKETEREESEYVCKDSVKTVDYVGEEDPEYVDLDDDVYSAVIFTLTTDVSELYSTTDSDGLDIKVNIYRACFTLTLLAVNYLLQIGILVWVYWYVASPTLHRAQRVYQRYHHDVFEDGEFQEELWNAWDWKQQHALCRIAFSNYWFLYAILSLWWLAMVTEATKTWTLFTKINSLGHTNDGSQMVKIKLSDEDPDEDVNHVYSLLISVRIGLCTLIILPKFAIAAGLLWVGSVWLAATDSFENLVLNSVALTFIINIDESIFQGLVPGTMKTNIGKTKLVRPRLKEEYEQEVKGAYRGVTLQLITVVVGVAAYMSEFGQSIPYVGIFPGYAADNDIACAKMWNVQRTLVCSRGEECFAFG
jgi:hypothetical protein